MIKYGDSYTAEDMLALLKKARSSLNEAIEALDAAEKIDGPEIRENELLGTMCFTNELGPLYSFMVDDLDDLICKTEEIVAKKR
ncbi:hypothetical protein L1O03_00580 [Corynebacterium uropygiale]|uniref:Uncharacterized protein n=1 Tax=Corynebacterium uropygiale TaxID=1775911 RepID=A0A9X1QLY2_9CORY|nr:hypothetical protein [Corynebacterium uropygiale]MCF4005679.1 hypothetical protein [Corynebacterium uropygiale]